MIAVYLSFPLSFSWWVVVVKKTNIPRSPDQCPSHHRQLQDQNWQPLRVVQLARIQTFSIISILPSVLTVNAYQDLCCDISRARSYFGRNSKKTECEEMWGAIWPKHILREACAVFRGAPARGLVFSAVTQGTRLCQRVKQCSATMGEMSRIWMSSRKNYFQNYYQQQGYQITCQQKMSTNFMPASNLSKQR